MNREESRTFFRNKNARRKLVTDPETRHRNRTMGQLLAMRLFEGGPKKSRNRAANPRPVG